MIEMTILNSLPLELLIEVLHHLETNDLVSLASIPELSSTLAPLMSVIYDSEDEASKFSPLGTEMSQMGEVDIKRPFLIAVISSFSKSIPKLLKMELLTQTSPSIYPKMRIGVIDNNLNWGSRLMRYLDLPFQSVSFLNITHLELFKITLDPTVLDFPVLRDLDLSTCQTNSDEKFRFPLLSELSVNWSVSGVMRSLDFEKTPLERLILYRPDLEFFQDVRCSTLKSLSLFWNSYRRMILRNIHMENLEILGVGSIYVESISDSFFGKVTELSLNSSSDCFRPAVKTCSFNRVQMPMLRSLCITVNDKLTFSEVSFPLLQKVSLEFENTPISTENARELGSGLLNKVPNLVLKNCSEILFHISKRTLGSLVIKDDFFDFSQIGDSSLAFPNIGQLSIHSRYNPGNMGLIEKVFPNTKSILIYVNDDTSWASFPPLLKLLRITFRTLSSRSVSFSDHSFTKLKVLDVQLCHDLGSLNANCSVDDFRLIHSYPLLEHLRIRGCAKNITLESHLCKLKTIKISENKRLLSFKTSHRMDELMSITCTGETPYIDDFDKVDAPKLAGIGQSFRTTGKPSHSIVCRERTTRRDKNSQCV